MFYVINKSKIYSYVVALSTVVILFVATAKLNESVPTLSDNIIQNSINTINSDNTYENIILE